MTSEYQIPEDLRATLGMDDSNFFPGELPLDTIDFGQLDMMSNTNLEPMQLQTVPQVTISSSSSNISSISTEARNAPCLDYPSVYSPIQHSPESGFGEESSGVQSPYTDRSTPGLLSPLNDYSSSYSPQSSHSPASSLYGEAGDYHVPQQFNQGSSNDLTKQISINIPEGTKHKYRHAKEMKIGHGGLKGEITLPSNYKTSHYRLILSVVPSTESKQLIHPCMLHVTVMNQSSKQKRAKYRTELKKPADWKVTLDVEYGKVFYVPNYVTSEQVKLERFEIDCLKNGRIILGGNNLQLTIISPLQGKKEAEGIKLVSVIKERIEAEQWNLNQTPDQIANAYTKAKASKVDLHICRLRVQIYKQSFVKYPNMAITHHWAFMDMDISNEIIDGRDQNVGSFDLECMSEPNQCCTKGEWKVMLISKYKTATVGKDREMSPPVFPVFIFVDEFGVISKPESYWPTFKQIDTSAANLTIHGGAFVFKVPAQHHDVINGIQQYGRKLKLALHRTLDGYYSETTFDFNYQPHYDGCPFCMIRLCNEYNPRKIPNGNFKKRKRTMSYEVSPQHQQDCSPDKPIVKVTTLSQEPGLGTIDFDISDCEEDIKMEPELVQDGDQLKTTDNIENPTSDTAKEQMSCEKHRNANIIPDVFHEDTALTKEESDDENSYYEDENLSSDENSDARSTSDEDYDDDNNYADELKDKIENRTLWEENDGHPKETFTRKVSLGDESVDTKNLEEEVTSSSITPSKPPKAENSADLINKNVEGNSTALNKDEKKKNVKEEKTIPLSLVYIFSIILSLVLGWVAGYFSLHYEHIISLALVAIVSGVFLGWCFDDKHGRA